MISVDDVGGGRLDSLYSVFSYFCSVLNILARGGEDLISLLLMA
jgi:hypothetical protein